MKITYFVRDPREGNFSLEKIFQQIGDDLSRNFEVDYFYVNNRKSRLWNIREAAKNQGDINHITGDVNWLIYGLDAKRTIITVHDIGHYENTLKGIKRFIYGIFWWQVPLFKTYMITSISDFTRTQLIKYFHIQPEKISVVHDPISAGFSFSKFDFNDKKPIILQVGSMPNKNVESLIDAVKDIPCFLKLLRLHDNKLSERMNVLGIEHTFYSNLSDEAVIKLYQNSDLLYFASTYEGFGLPIIEAQAVGRPVITSNIPPMPEVAGTGAHLVDPYSVSDIRAGILKIINDADYRNKLVEDGLKNISRFEVERISNQYLNIYNKLFVN